MTTPTAHLSASLAIATAAILVAAGTAMATRITSTPRPPDAHAAAVARVVTSPTVHSVPETAEGPFSRLWTISYDAHNGLARPAVVIAPGKYGPGHDSQPLPLVISPHGRAGTGLSNSRFWGDLPGRGGFVVVNPDGMGRELRSFSYGYSGQIDDLAAMPEIVERALPWLRIDRSRIYALGSSMGGQETLMLVARHPGLLAGAAAMDSVTDLARRYDQLPAVPCDRRCRERWGEPIGVTFQSAMRREIGGTPVDAPAAYAARSALSQAGAIAASRVPLQIWWSTRDRIVADQEHQSEALFRELRRLDPTAPVSAYQGRWAHSKEMRASALLPLALEGFGLLPQGNCHRPASVRHFAAPAVTP